MVTVRIQEAFSTIAISNVPVQFIPFPEKPLLHAQVKLPWVLVHVALE